MMAKLMQLQQDKRTQMAWFVAFGVLILILIFKPAGLLGKAVSEKV